uniref:Uncharacterized protein n=1 Tax=Onchocerca volvulus TaxID=6282 RepID=A0A8R1TPS2_ONCVO
MMSNPQGTQIIQFKHAVTDAAHFPNRMCRIVITSASVSLFRDQLLFTVIVLGWNVFAYLHPCVFVKISQSIQANLKN